jgi:hypothetical protein
MTVLNWSTRCKIEMNGEGGANSSDLFLFVGKAKTPRDYASFTCNDGHQNGLYII